MSLSVHRFMRRYQMLVGIFIGVLLNLNLQVPVARGTANPLAQMISPTGTLVTVANTLQSVPKPTGYTGQYCTVVLWNNSTEPLYWGGPAGVGAVTTAGGMPICTNLAVCRDSWVSIDSRNVAVISTNAIAAGNIRYAFGTGC